MSSSGNCIFVSVNTRSRDQVISGPFLNLPSRELRDYYQTIKHPQCLKGIQKQVRGIKGRDKPTGTSLFKSWQAFEDEVNNIWNNARLYNEDGSPIFELANEMEVCKIYLSKVSLINSFKRHISSNGYHKPRK